MPSSHSMPASVDPPSTAQCTSVNRPLPGVQMDRLAGWLLLLQQHTFCNSAVAILNILYRSVNLIPKNISFWAVRSPVIWSETGTTSDTISVANHCDTFVALPVLSFQITALLSVVSSNSELGAKVVSWLSSDGLSTRTHRGSRQITRKMQS
jgi:hypothetical protein